MLHLEREHAIGQAVRLNRFADDVLDSDNWTADRQRDAEVAALRSIAHSLSVIASVLDAACPGDSLNVNLP